MVDRLSPLDASFLHIEDDVSHMHIASVAIFEGPAPTYEDVVAMVASKLPLVPRYRQVVKFVPLQLGRPVWVDDPHFNLNYHVRATALASPGSEDQLRTLVGRVMSQQLDRAKPLWEMWMVEGLDSGHWALMSKTHHCMVDGVSGTDLLTVVLDQEPSPARNTVDDWQPEAQPSRLDLLTQAIGERVTSPYEQLRGIRSATRAPRQVVEQVTEVAQGIRSLAGLARATPESTLNGPIGPHRRWAWARSTLADVKTIRAGLGGTVNDVVLAAITRGFRDLLESRGETTDRVVRTLVPVSVRVKGVAGPAQGDGTFDNKVSAMFAELPVGISDARERLDAIHAQMGTLKESKQAVAGEALTSLTGFAPPMLLALGTRVFSRVPQRNVNTVTTNVPGPQFPLYAAGRKMLEAFPYVPLAGSVRVGVAIFSYNGMINFGVTGDYDTAPDIAVLCEGIEDGMAELVKLAQ
ncbi:MAG TPA: wax ester/triacylglycerol synthase family O-acyltransferase [Acidimicrobiales bacterium]|jgi:diacylglycerol O-acyltransferase / wax synthase|nr:wax ester/triacylglycerol synthase family O-acyltransferase [Acidimicrobiales bacterium]